MNLNKLLKDYVNKREKRERKIGRYWSSDLYQILTGKLLPEEFLKKQKTLDLTACKNITEGEFRESALKELLDFGKIDYKYQQKKVKKIQDFELVVIADFLFKDKVLECKSPNIMPDKIRDYHKPQLEAQHRVFRQPIFVCYLKERFENKFFKYEPDEKLWQKILAKLEEFHLALKELESKGFGME